MSTVDHRRKVGVVALQRRNRVAYQILLGALVSAITWTIGTVAYAYASTGTPSSQIYTIGRQSTLTGAVIILLIVIISVRRNLRRSRRIE